MADTKALRAFVRKDVRVRLSPAAQSPELAGQQQLQKLKLLLY